MSHLFRLFLRQRHCSTARHPALATINRHSHRFHRRQFHACAPDHSFSRRFGWRRQQQQQLEEDDGDDGTLWRQRLDAFPKDMTRELAEYPFVTAKELRTRVNRPKRVKMLTRDFIDDSLYNPHYGYFSKHATIFTPGEPFDFNNIDDGPAFNRLVDQRYIDFENELDKTQPDDTRQLWHTPTELFSPYYGEAIARYLVTNYRLTLFPYHDLIIYEMGAGNGTTMLNILDYIRDVDPEVYHRTQFKVIEISSTLAGVQQSALNSSIYAAGHAGHVEIINRSIFEWDTYVHSPCFFLAFEVFDNFSHDAIRYDLETAAPRQGCVLVDGDGDFYEYYVDNIDSVASRFLRVRRNALRTPAPPPLPPYWRRKLQQSMPFAPNMTLPEYVPTRLMQFFDVLRDYFPAHRLVAGDFSCLPDTVPGLNAPVVQTRYKRETIAVTTPFVHQGYFDIFFPTNFDVIEDIYRSITGKLTVTTTHSDFLERWAYIEDTETRDGDNPLLTWYKNANVLLTV